MSQKRLTATKRPRQPAQVNNLLDDTALTRIIESVGPKYVPTSLCRDKLGNDTAWRANRKRFSDDLEWVANWYNTSHALRSSETKQCKTLGKILKAAQHLEKLVSGDGRMLILNIRSVDHPEDPQVTLTWLIDNVTRVIAERRKAPIEVSTILQSEHSLKHIAGVVLPSIFERHFERECGVSGAPNTGKPYGPGVRFVEQAMRELGMPYKTESVASAISELKRKATTTPPRQNSRSNTPEKELLTGRIASNSEREELYRLQSRSMESAGRSLGYCEDHIGWATETLLPSKHKKSAKRIPR
jgi:hypothetical protein